MTSTDQWPLSMSLLYNYIYYKQLIKNALSQHKFTSGFIPSTAGCCLGLLYGTTHNIPYVRTHNNNININIIVIFLAFVFSCTIEIKKLFYKFRSRTMS